MRSVIKLNNDLIVFSLTFFLALISIMKIPVLPKIIIQTLKLVAIIFIFLYIFKNPKKVKIHDQFDIIAFGLVVIISSYINYRITPYFFYGVIYAFMLFGIFVILPTAIYNNGIAPVVKVIFICFFTICMVNDFCLGKCIDSNYLIGTKFSVSYWHCILILMYSLSFQIHGVAYKFFLIIFTFWSLIIAFLIKCSTGLIAITLLFILLFFGNILGKFLIKPIPLLATILMIGYSIYLWDIILSSDNVKNFIINVLHEGLTLTGRIQIYKMLPKLAQEKPIIGWGYGTEIVRDKLYGNAQNGVWHIGE